MIHSAKQSPNHLYWQILHLLLDSSRLQKRPEYQIYILINKDVEHILHLTMNTFLKTTLILDNSQMGHRT